MRKFFYGRVSTKEQSLDNQIKIAKELEIEDDCILIEKQSGKTFDRAEYQFLKRLLREDDILYIKSLDRLGRNKRLLLDEWKDITQNIKANIVVLDMPILDTTKYKEMDDIGNLISDIVLQLFAYMAEDERTRMLKRQREGIMTAKERGQIFGRQKINPGEQFEEIYAKWKRKEITAVAAMGLLGLKANTFYRRVREYEDSKK